MYPVHVAQLNINVTPEFERALQQLMRARGIGNKSEAVRLAVIEAAERARARPRVDFAALIGTGLRVPPRARPRFANEDDLWK